MLRSTLLALTAGLLLAGAAQAAPKVRLYALDCGRLLQEDADFYADDGAYKGRKVDMVVPCYLIRHPKGDMLWESGLPGTREPLLAQLKTLGLAPRDVEYLSLSHTHFDHAGNAGLFAGSTWIVPRAERDWAFQPAKRKNAAQFQQYAALEGARTVLMEGDEPHDVFGDGTVQVIPAPGHTPGHTILLVKLPKAGPVLLTGDLWHVAESRAARRVPRFNVDRPRTLASYERAEALAAAEKARVVREHVPEDFAALPAFPTPLE